MRTLFDHIVWRLIEEKGEVPVKDLNKLLEYVKAHQAELQAVLGGVKRTVDNAKAEATSAGEVKFVLKDLGTSVGELEKKVRFDLQKLSYFLSAVGFVADKFNVATALELINQLNSLTPQQLENAVVLTQPQIKTITEIAPLLNQLVISLEKGAKPKDVLDIATQIRDALEKMGVPLDAVQLIRVVNALQTITKEFNLKVSDIASLIAVNDVNGLTVIPVPVVSNIKSLVTSTQAVNSRVSGNVITAGTEEIPATTLTVGTIPIQGQTLEQLQQLLTPPPVTPPNATPEEGGSQGGGRVALPPSYSTPQFASYQSKQQYLII